MKKDKGYLVLERVIQSCGISNEGIADAYEKLEFKEDLSKKAALHEEGLVQMIENDPHLASFLRCISKTEGPKYVLAMLNQYDPEAREQQSLSKMHYRAVASILPKINEEALGKPMNPRFKLKYNPEYFKERGLPVPTRVG